MKHLLKGFCLFAGGFIAGKVMTQKAVKQTLNELYDRDNNLGNSHANFTAKIKQEIILESRKDAEDVLDTMRNMISTYGVVSVADLHDLTGAIANYTDSNYGWTALNSAKVVRVRNGYLLKLPRPKTLSTRRKHNA